MIDTTKLDEILKRNNVQPIANNTSGNDWYSSLDRNIRKVPATQYEISMGIKTPDGSKNLGLPDSPDLKTTIKNRQEANKDATPLQQVGNVAGLATDIANKGLEKIPVVGGVLKLVGKTFGDIVNEVGNKIGDIPAVQKFAMSLSPEEFTQWTKNLQAVSDIGNLALLATGAEKSKLTVGELPTLAKDVATKTTELAKSATENVVEATKPIINKVKDIKEGIFTKDFKKNYDKAFPPSAKDIKLGEERYTRTNDLMHYIVNGKDAIGIEDAKGNIKSPSQYTVADNLTALKKIQPDIYQSYTKLLEGADADKFKSNIALETERIATDLETKLTKTISEPNRNITQNIINELRSDQMQNASPLDVQNYIQDLGKRAFTGTMNEGKSVIADTGSRLTNILSKTLDNLEGNQYKELKNLYRATVESKEGWSRAALKEIKNTPDMYQKLTGMGMTAEGINFLISHDPQALAIALGFKSLNMFTKWLKSPQRAMQSIYKNIEKSPINQ